MCAGALEDPDLSPLAPQEAEAAAEDVVEGGGDSLVLTTLDGGRPQVEVVQVDGTQEAGELAGEVARDSTLVAVEADVAARVDEDALEGSQWALGTLGAAEAWTRSTGAGTVIAVVDTGVEASHVDLAGRVLVGRTFLNQGSESAGAVDEHGHGTHVAGIAAAGRNGTGIVGLAPDAQILPVRALGANGSGWLSDVASAVVWATDNGADVVNLSLGGGSGSSALASAVQYATDHGVVVVASAGNNGACGPTSWPAAYTEVIAVAATTSNGSVASYSTTGSYVDVAAPGSTILSSVIGGGWGYKSGTSMAAPYVAGAAALIVAAEPGVGVGEVRERLESTATDIATVGKDQWSGWGLIDPTAALDAGDGPSPV